MLARTVLAVSMLATALPVTAALEPSHARESSTVLFSPEGNNLNAYDADAPFTKQTVIKAQSRDPEGRDINGQVCFLRGSNRFIAGEDTGQPEVPPGWGVFQLKGKRVGEFEARQIGKLNTTFQQPPDLGDPYGCGVLSDGRVVTSDIGASVTGPGNGQLVMWFPPFKRGLDGREVPFCKLDVGVATAQGIYVDEQDRIYLASARGSTGGVLRYSGPFPTSDDAGGGCGKRDATGAPLVDAVHREQFIGAAQNFASASGIARSSSGGFYVSSVVGGRIAEFDAAGTVVRDVLAPKQGESLGTYSAGTPFGLTVDARGTLYYADLDLVISPDGIGPGPDGKVWRIRFVDDDPQPPEVIDRNLRFPDGLGVLQHNRVRSPAPRHHTTHGRAPTDRAVP
jgi:hypothetical protein